MDDINNLKLAKQSIAVYKNKIEKLDRNNPDDKELFAFYEKRLDECERLVSVLEKDLPISPESDLKEPENIDAPVTSKTSKREEPDDYEYPTF